MSTEDEVQNFIKRLDDLLLRYNDLINMNFDKEYLRTMKFQEMKYKEKISALEAKLRLTKKKLKFETNLRLKSEEEHEKIVKTLKSKSINESMRRDIFSNSNSTSNDHFITAANSLILSENDLNESNLLSSSFRKHRAHLHISCDNEVGSNVKSDVLKISSKTWNRFSTKIKSPDISYSGFEKLKKKHLDKLEKSSEPSPIKNIDVRNQIKYSSSQNAQMILKSTPSKNFNLSYLSARKESTPLYRKATTYMNVTLDHSHLHDLSKNERNISRLAPLIPPMIPMVVIHCIDEIEKRGLEEIGLYRLAGDEEDIMILYEKFEDFDTNVDLSEINIHSITAFLKNFLCNFPLIPKPFHDSFIQVIENSRDDLYYAISDLPQANRDTLAYLIIHLRRVSFSDLCKMSTWRLSAVFGPIVFGMQICDKENQLYDIPVRIVEELLKLPSSYWNSFIIDPTNSETPTKLRNSPITEMIIHKKTTKYFSKNGPKKKFFK